MGWKYRSSFDGINGDKGLWHSCCRPVFFVTGVDDVFLNSVTLLNTVLRFSCTVERYL